MVLLTTHNICFGLRNKKYTLLSGGLPRGYKTCFMLNSTEHEISTAHINAEQEGQITFNRSHEIGT